MPLGIGAEREAFGLVTSLPHSTVFTFGRTAAELCSAFLSCLERLGGVPEAAVMDNEGANVVRTGGRPRLTDDVAALFGALLLRPIVLRRFGSLGDLQNQHGCWAETVAHERWHRRVGANGQKTPCGWSGATCGPCPTPPPTSDPTSGSG